MLPEAQIRAREEAWLTAVLQRDSTALSALLARSFTFRVEGVDQPYSRPTAVGEGHSQADVAVAQLSDVCIRVVADTGYVALCQQVRLRVPRSGRAHTQLFADRWERRGGVWQAYRRVALDQVDMPRPPACRVLEVRERLLRD
jgi:hypothetical protein